MVMQSSSWILIHIVTRLSDHRRGIGLTIGFISNNSYTQVQYNEL
jgi:hypothetical protein